MGLKKKTPRAQRDPNAVVLYLRVSTADQAESGLSIPAQQRALEAHCRERGFEICATYIEPGASARDDQRPVFKRMIAEVLGASSRVGTVLVYHSSRFMRNVLQAQAYKAQLRKQGVRVASSQHNASDDPQGRMAEQIFEAMDQYESDINGVRTSAAMAENATQGFFNGSKPPFGFSIEKVEARPGTFKNKLVPNPMEADAMREVFRLYVGGSGAKATARDLNQRGVRYRTGLWSSDLVLKVIQEEAAIGTYYWGRRDHGVAREKDAWVPSKVAPIIERDLFDLAQQIREERDPERHPGRAPSSPLLLARLLRCGRCGSACALETSGKLGPDGEHTYRYYNCRAFTRVGKEACVGCRVPVAVLDEAVLQHLGEKVFSTERCHEFLRAFVEETGVLRTKTADQRRELDRQLADIDRRIAKWEEAFENGGEAFDVIAPRVRELKAKREEVASVLAKIVPIRHVPPHLYAEATIKKFQASMKEVLLTNRAGIAKNYLRMLVASIKLTPGPDTVAVEIAARTDAAVAMIAVGGGKDGLNQPDRVLTTVGHWRPRHGSNVRPTV